jgi:hypothetical protein
VTLKKPPRELYKTTKPASGFCGKSTKNQTPVFFCREILDNPFCRRYNGHKKSSNDRIKKAIENKKEPEDDIEVPKPVPGRENL